MTLNYQLRPEDWLRLYKNNLLTPFSELEIKSIQKRYVQFQRRIRQFSRLGRKCYLVPYNNNLTADVHTFLENYFPGDKAGNIDAYENMLSIDWKTINGKNSFSWIGYLEGTETPVAFYFAGRTGDDSAGFYCGIASRIIPGLPEFLDKQFLSCLVDEGIRYLNCGGSETFGLHSFKHRLAPVEER